MSARTDNIRDQLRLWGSDFQPPDPEFRGWLALNYPAWHSRDEFVEYSPAPSKDNMLSRDGIDYMIIWPQSGMMFGNHENFVRQGLLAIGGGANGDPLVIDTRCQTAWSLSFIPHEGCDYYAHGDLRSTMEALPDPLETFWGALFRDENYPLDAYH